MNVFNRVVIVVGLLLTMVFSAVLFLATGPLLRTLIPFLQQLEANIATVSSSGDFLRLLAGFVFTTLIWIVCAVLLWLELRKSRPKAVKLAGEGGDSELTVDSIVSRLQHNISQLPGIRKVKPAVKSGRNGVKVTLTLETDPEVDVPAKTEEVQRLTRNMIEDKMGLQLDRVRIIMRSVPYPKKKKGEQPESSTDTTTEIREWKAESGVESRKMGAEATSEASEAVSYEPSSVAGPVFEEPEPLEAIDLDTTQGDEVILSSPPDEEAANADSLD